MLTKKKVISYIVRTHRNLKEILVFDHAGIPEAGVQVIGGTVETGEDLKLALKREIKEESGLNFEIEEMMYLGETFYERKDRDELNHRTYFLINGENLENTFSHIVQSDGEDNGLEFLFYWLSFKEANKILTGNFQELLNKVE